MPRVEVRQRTPPHTGTSGCQLAAVWPMKYDTFVPSASSGTSCGCGLAPTNVMRRFTTVMGCVAVTGPNGAAKPGRPAIPV